LSFSFSFPLITGIKHLPTHLNVLGWQLSAKNVKTELLTALKDIDFLGLLKLQMQALPG
jgi:hypothetical protein